MLNEQVKKYILKSSLAIKQDFLVPKALEIVF